MDMITFLDRDMPQRQINEEVRRDIEALLNEGIVDPVSYSEDEVYRILGIER